jgi:hypothetical protein
MHGDVLSILNATGAKHTTFDVLFTEPSADAQQDTRLKVAIEKLPDVTLAYHFEQAEARQRRARVRRSRPHFIAKDARRPARPGCERPAIRAGSSARSLLSRNCRSATER